MLKQSSDFLQWYYRWLEPRRHYVPVAHDLADLARDVFGDERLPMDDGRTAIDALREIQGTVGFQDGLYDDQIGKVSVIGVGMRSHPGVSATAFRALAEAGINIEMISTSEIRVSVVTRADQLDDAVRAVHTAFGLDSASGEAVVYGGTGR